VKNVLTKNIRNNHISLDLAPCKLLEVFRRFVETFCHCHQPPHHHPSTPCRRANLVINEQEAGFPYCLLNVGCLNGLFFYPENGGSTFRRNIDKLLKGFENGV
jgi:hypothetical protein